MVKPDPPEKPAAWRAISTPSCSRPCGRSRNGGTPRPRRDLDAIAAGDTVSVRALLDLQAATLEESYADRPEVKATMVEVHADGYDRLGLGSRRPSPCSVSEETAQRSSRRRRSTEKPRFAAGRAASVFSRPTLLSRTDRVPGHPALSRTDHRPWPIPARPWTWRQTWHDLLFLHWPVPAAALRPLVPERLVIEEFDGSAWVAVTPFRMSGVTLRWIPPLPLLSRFPELNVRTYVSYGGTPGVWFFSLDAGNPVAVRVARRWFHLPYVYARMRVRGAGDRVEYRSVRPSGAGFEATYQPIAPAEVRRPGTLEHWLTERYCLYAVSWTGDLHRAEIQHEPWPLQEATVTIHRNDMLHLHGIAAGQVPHVLFARRLDVVVWSLQPVTDRREDRP